MTSPAPTPAPRGSHIHETGSEVTAYRRMLEATDPRQKLQSQREEDAR